jgi:hypothetical protein
MVVTMVEAEVAPERADDLRRAYREVVAEGLPDYIVETFLLQLTASSTWRIATVWRDRSDVERLRASGETPPAMAIFAAAGADHPSLGIFEVAERATH